MHNPINTVGIIGKYANKDIGEQIKTLNDFLVRHEINVILDQNTAQSTAISNLHSTSRQEMAALCDLVIVMGGDGTLLNSARSLAYYDVPLLGINMGHLGFLTDITIDDMDSKLSEILSGNFIAEERLLLRAEIIRDGVAISDNIAFNDVVVHKWEEARMLEFETVIDNAFVNTQRSDGLILATPTGSTAYALSGGGPILTPTLHAIILVPICPHTLSQRPLVIGGDSVIEITISEGGHARAQVTCDGQINLGVVAGDRIKIHRLDRKITLLHPADYNYFEILRAKLRWGEKL